MLPVTRSISPPSVVGDDRDQGRAFPDIVPAPLRVYRLVADRNSDRDTADDPALGIVFPRFEVAGFALDNAAAHEPARRAEKVAQPVVERHEYLREGGQFGPDHELALVYPVFTAGRIGHERGIIVQIPDVVAGLSREDVRFRGCIERLMGRGAEEQVDVRITANHLAESAPGRRIIQPADPNVGGKGLGKDHERHLRRVRTRGEFGFEQTGHLGILLPLGNCALLLPWVEVRLGHHHVQSPGVRTLFAAAIEHGGGDHGPDDDEREANRGRITGLRGPALPPPVREGDHEPEEAEVDRPYPERASEHARPLVPLDQAGRAGERVTEAEPWPADLGLDEVETLPGDPHRREEDIGQHARKALLANAEEAEDHGHLERVREAGEDSSADRGFTDPPCSQGVEKDEGGIVPPEKALYPESAREAFGAEQRHKGHEGHDTGMGDEPGQAHHNREREEQQRYQSFFLIHLLFLQAYCRSSGATCPAGGSYPRAGRNRTGGVSRWTGERSPASWHGGPDEGRFRSSFG